MHVAPIDLRAIRQGGLAIRFAMLGEMAYVMAEIPDSGSAGTSLEQPCQQPHWGFVIEGALMFVTEGRSLVIPAGRAFHVPAGGPEHHFESAGSAIVAGFAPVEPETDLTDEDLVARGFELSTAASSASVVPAIPIRRVPAGQVRTESWPMSAYLMTRVRMGERSGYTGGWCDAPHWGLVTEGRIAIEWEHDVEILGKGDIFHCQAGPPGHRLEAADPATIIDLTPVSALQTTSRLADWRRASDPTALRSTRGIAVTALG
jgi:quercetin dioxygenase-like cupin family protein